MPDETFARTSGIARDEPSAACDATAGPACVLVVDDDDGVRVSIVRMLQALGWRAEPADAEQAALETARRLGGELWAVLLDLSVVGDRCAEMLERLRAFSPRVRVLLMSGSLEQDASAMGGEPFWDDFLAKPFTPQLLLAALEGLRERDARAARQPSAPER